MVDIPPNTVSFHDCMNMCYFCGTCTCTAMCTLCVHVHVSCSVYFCSPLKQHRILYSEIGQSVHVCITLLQTYTRLQRLLLCLSHKQTLACLVKTVTGSWSPNVVWEHWKNYDTIAKYMFMFYSPVKSPTTNEEWSWNWVLNTFFIHMFVIV